MPPNDAFTVDTELSRIDLSKVHGWLSTDPYWALGRSEETTKRAADNSVNFGVYNIDGELCDYACVVTDFTTFDSCATSYIDRQFRDLGLGGLLAQSVVDTLTPGNSNECFFRRSTRTVSTSRWDSYHSPTRRS